MSKREKCRVCGSDNFPIYRTCGRGCSHAIAYCVNHGGDERAKAEMQVHHAAHDQPMELRTPGPQNQTDGFCRGYWAMADGTAYREESDSELRERVKKALVIT